MPFNYATGKCDDAPSGESSEMDKLKRQMKLHKQEIAEMQRKIEQLESRSGVGTVQDHSGGNTPPLDVVLSLIPAFDGEEPDFINFAEACEGAVSMIPESLELCLVGCIKLGKLTGDARDLVMGKKFSTVKEFLDFLYDYFGSKHSADVSMEKLYFMYRKPGETVVRYGSRIRKLAACIDYVEKRKNQTATAKSANTIDKILKLRFLKGLNLDISTSKEESFDEVFLKAVDIETDLDDWREIREADSEDCEDFNENFTQQIICQICDLPGHAADNCGQIPRYQNRNCNRHPRSQHTRRNINHREQFCTDSNRYKGPRNDKFSNSNSRYSNASNNSKDNVSSRSLNRQELFCTHCKLNGHLLENCRQRIYNNAIRAKSPNSNNEYKGHVPNSSRLNVQSNALDVDCTASSVDDNSQVKETNVKQSDRSNSHWPFVVQLNSDSFVKPCNFILSTGSGASIMKIRNLRPEIAIHTKEASPLYDITNSPVSTLGLVQVNMYGYPVVLYLVEDDYDIPHEGIVGSNFIVSCSATVDCASSQIKIGSYVIPFEKCGQMDDPETSGVIRSFTLLGPRPTLVQDTE